MLTLDDIIEIDITPEMVEEAREEHARLIKKNMSPKTRLVMDNHNVIGSLAHQAVEIALENMGVAYTSYRREIYVGGDKCDIEYDTDTIDVKGTHGILDKWFYNKDFLVFADQLKDEKIKEISHFLFTLVHKDLTTVWIFGIITVSEFLDRATPVRLKYDNLAIKARYLRPFRSYIFRV